MLSFTKENKINSSSLSLLLENRFFMQPTYSVVEIKSLIRALDEASFKILKELVEDEKEGFTPLELKTINKFIKLKNKELVRNEVKMEFLLSFN